MDLEEYILDLENDDLEISKDKFNRSEEAFELFCELYDNNYGRLLMNDNLISISTGGWSENEHLIYQLKKTGWWSKQHCIEMQGGHYYIDTGRYSKGKKHWKIIKE